MPASPFAVEGETMAELEWTEGVPEKSGYYWRRRAYTHPETRKKDWYDAELVNFSDGSLFQNGELVHLKNSEQRSSLWAGPIIPPPSDHKKESAPPLPPLPQYNMFVPEQSASVPLQMAPLVLEKCCAECNGNGNGNEAAIAACPDCYGVGWRLTGDGLRVMDAVLRHLKLQIK
jgi:hypothetical protein